MSWEPLPIGMRSAKPRVPYIRWSPEANGDRNHQRYHAYLSLPARELCAEIAKAKRIEKAGITVLRGSGEHEGMFALSIVPFEPRHPTMVRLQPGGAFTAGALAPVQESGISELRREGDLLIGHFGTTYDRKPKAPKRDPVRKKPVPSHEGHTSAVHHPPAGPA